jgi:alpha-amylase
VPHVRFAFVLHNHQPVGNFDDVFERALADSYEPFLDVLEKFPRVPVAIHTSGSLLEWLERKRPVYVDRLRRLVEKGRVEILGGGFYEPILTMIPSADRRGQILGYTQHLEDLFNQRIRGMWVPERVWEQNLVGDIAAAGIEYTLLDDAHFLRAGRERAELTGWFTTEDAGRLLKVFPVDEPLRYAIPFQDVDRSIALLRELAERQPGAIAVCADDGEKFGSWPGTKAHVYEHGWLHRFFEAIERHRDWLEPLTPSEAMDQTGSVGRVFFPDGSYREMTEWALPTARQLEYRRLWDELEHAPGRDLVRRYLRAGHWRNFLVRYPESNEMYCRMLGLSERLRRHERDDSGALGDARLYRARQALFRSQCNCPYWHGSFGGLYLPHLRQAIHSGLIEAEEHLLEYERPAGGPWVDAESADFNLDGHPEIRLENDRLSMLIAPSGGGAVHAFDVRAIRQNLLATLDRRPEPYHEKVRHSALNRHAGVGYERDRMDLADGQLDRLLAADRWPRKGFVTHLTPAGVSLDDLRHFRVEPRPAFTLGPWRSSLTRRDDVVRTTLVATETLPEGRLMVSKRLELEAGASGPAGLIRVEKPVGVALDLILEWNVAVLPAGQPDRWFRSADGERLGQLGSDVSSGDCDGLTLVDEWLGVEFAIALGKPADLLSFPIETVSHSEGGFELVHQSTCVWFRWSIPADVTAWESGISLEADTSVAETRQFSRAGI